jgi:hypothetical protein
VTTSASTTFTSATAAFTANDVGRSISGVNITPGTTIVSITSATAVIMSAVAATAGTVETVTIGIAVPTPTYSAITAQAGWQGTVSIAGTQRTSANVVLDAELDLKRDVTVNPGITGSASPVFTFSGPVDVTGKMTIVFTDPTDYNNMINNTQPVVVINFTQGASTTLQQLQFTMTKCAFTATEPDRGSDYVKAAITFTGRANTTDVGASAGFSPLKTVVQNAVASGHYQ